MNISNIFLAQAQHPDREISYLKKSIIYPKEWLIYSKENKLIWDYFTSLPPGVNTTRALQVIAGLREKEQLATFHDSLFSIKAKLFISGDYFLLGSTSNYFHYVYDVLPRLFFWLEVDKIKNYNVIVDKHTISSNESFQNQWLKLLEIDNQKLTCIHENLPTIIDGNLACPHARKDLRYGDSHGSKYFLISYLRELVNRKVLLGLCSINQFSRIFISRKDGNTRLEAIDEAERIAIKHGYSIIYSEEHSVKQQLSIFKSAQIIIGLGGAGMANCLFARKSTLIRFIANEKDVTYVSPKNMGWAKINDSRFLVPEYQYYARYLKYLGYDIKCVSFPENKSAFSNRFSTFLNELNCC